MEGVAITAAGVDRHFWRGRSVLITGHTGFKGGWLATWLLDMGARVSGFALEPDTEPSFFTLCRLDQRMTSITGDIRDSACIRKTMEACQPEIVFHLAAQSLVRRSYREPVETFAANLMGTVNVLEAVRHTRSVRAVAVITSDKCYENREWLWGYRESDPLGGRDPYSASKACAELAVAAYRRSFFENGSSAAVATVRAGNVIGGGDWAEDRLVPDAIRALQRGAPLIVRNPASVRPWQHVLEPLAGYLMLAERLCIEGRKWAGAWNFGPRDEDVAPVGSLADMVVAQWRGGSWRRESANDAPHEAGHLKLDCGKARALLGWKPALTLAEAVAMTVAWYRAALSEPPDDLYRLACAQIRRYERRLAGEAAEAQ